MKQRELIARRRFMKNLGLGAGAGLFGPMLAGMAPRALGQPSRKKRLFLYADGIGLPPEYRPQAIGASDFNMGAFTSLAPYKSRALVVDGLYQPHLQHLHGNSWQLTVMPGMPGASVVAPLPGGISFDRLVAKTLSKNDPVSSFSAAAYTASTMSADGPGQPYPTILDPVAVYDFLFSKLVPAAPPGMSTGPSPAVLKDQSLLSFVGDDISRLQSRLAAPERTQLDQYLTSLRSIEMRLGKLAQAPTGGPSCMKPQPPSGNALVRELPTTGGMRGGRTPERLFVMRDMLVMALKCGITSVVQLMAEGSLMGFLGDINIGVHNLHWHSGNASYHTAYYKWASDNMAEILRQLDQTPEDNGTMADNTLLMYMNVTGGHHHNGSYDYMFMTFGSAGQALRPGRLLSLPRTAAVPNDPRTGTSMQPINQPTPLSGRAVPTTCVSEYLVTLAKALGVDINTFGDPKYFKAPLNGLS